MDRIVGGGAGGLGSAPAGAETGFSAPLFGALLAAVDALLAAVDALLAWAEARVGVVPALPGWVLVGLGLAGGILLPVSPFWLVLLLGLGVLVRACAAPSGAQDR